MLLLVFTWHLCAFMCCHTPIPCHSMLCVLPHPRRSLSVASNLSWLPSIAIRTADLLLGTPLPVPMLPALCAEIERANFHTRMASVLQTDPHSFQGRSYGLRPVHSFKHRLCVAILYKCCTMFCGMPNNCGVLRMHVCRVEDYWQGYKLFCYAYYSHSLQHESQFRDSKMGSCIPRSHWCQAIVILCSRHSLPSPLCLFVSHFDVASMFVCRRPTSLAPSHSRTCTFASTAPNIMLAAPPPHRDVLQVGVRGRLQRSPILNAAF